MSRAKGSISITYEQCLKMVEGCDSIKEWMDKDFNSYHTAFRNGWINKIIGEVGVKRLRVKKGLYSVESVAKEINKYESINDWKKRNEESYTWVRNRGKLKLVFELSGKKLYKYSFEDCVEDAKKFNSRFEWCSNGTTYYQSKTNNWIDEISDRVGYVKNSSNKQPWM